MHAAQVVAASGQCAQEVLRDCWNTRVVAHAGFYDRAAPLLVDDHEATERARQALAGYHAVLRQGYPERMALSLRNARVVGQGAALTRSGALIAETVAEFTANGVVPAGLLPGDADTFRVPRATRRIDRPCLLAKRPWYRNYGHWLVDCGTIIAMASSLGLTDGMSIVIGRYDNPAMEKVVRCTLEEFAWRSEVLIHPDEEVWEFDSLWYFTPLHVPPLFKLPSGLQALRTHFLASLGTAHSPSRKLFISRGNRLPRRLLNENELLGILVKSGFELVYPERLSLRQQAALFREAQVVVGVKGAALTNAMFMSPGSAAVVLSPADFPDPFFWDICGQFDVGYLELFGRATSDRAPGQAAFSIDTGRLLAALSLIGVDV
jgi:capsular polysaccharide biosynthesis protein